VSGKLVAVVEVVSVIDVVSKVVPEVDVDVESFQLS
jgi:hypothetical protein